MRRLRPRNRSVAGGAARPAERLPPRVFPVSAVRPPAGHGRRVLPDGGPQTRLQIRLRIGQNQRYCTQLIQQYSIYFH